MKELTDELIPLVDDFLHSNPLVNAYALWDLHHLRHRARFLLCMDGIKLKGVLLDYFSHTGIHFIGLCGDEDAVGRLLDVPLPERMIFHVFPELERIIRQKFSITAKYAVDFMLLQKGQERLYLRHRIKPLDLEDAYSLASLRKKKSGEREIKEAESLIKEQFYYGIFINSQLVSAASITVKLPEIWMLGGFYTKPECRNRGYATSLASFLVKEALRETEHVGLHVRADNHPAKHVYEKVGFKSYRKMCWLNYNTDLVP